MEKIKVLTVVGTRPELIRLSRLIPLLDKFTNHVLVHTGQNYDPNLSDIFFEDLELRPPDYYLGIRGDSLGKALGNLFPAVEEVLLKEAPDAVAILGDTNSALAAIVAERMGISVYHMEAGNRSFDKRVPEELNRKIVDHIASFNFPYTEHARRNLLREGLDGQRLCMTGSPMKEVLAYYESKIQSSSILEEIGISKGEYLLVSLHRQENVDSVETLTRNISAIEQAASSLNLPVVLSVHPRTLSKLEGFNIQLGNRFLAMAPLGFFDYIHLQKSAYCVISDSGSIGEEAAILRFPAVTVRMATERPEALEAGWIARAEPGTQLLPLISAAVSARHNRGIVQDYEIEDFSNRVLNFILSKSHSSRTL